MKKLYIPVLAGIILLLAACAKDENLDKPIVGLGGDTWVKSELDNWLYTTFTQPYNIGVIYRWDGGEVDNTKTLVPPDLSKVQPLMDVVNNAWILPYVKQKDDVFIKKYSPKEYLLVGSLQYNTNNSVTLGEAEGGTKVTLFNVNNFKPSDRDIVQRVLKTVHHEFTHILHQTVLYPKEFPLISQADYTADWSSSTNDTFFVKGFITKYAMAAPSEDFAEMSGIMLTQGRSGYETTLKVPKTDTVKIRKKEAILVSYFKQTWGIDFYSLQTKVQQAINSYAPGSLFPYLGFGKTFTRLNISAANLNYQSAEFAAAFNQAKAALAAVGSNQYSLDNMNLSFTADGVMLLKINYIGASGTLSATTYTHDVVSNATDQTLVFTLTGSDGNAAITAALKPLADYFTQAPFKLKYYYTPDANVEYGGLAKNTDNNSFTFGTLNLQ